MAPVCSPFWAKPDRTKEWIERGALLDPNNTILHFNFTCALARLGEIDAALDLLDRFIDKASPGMLLWFDNDTDLDPLRDNPRFIEIIQKAKARFAAGQEQAVRDAWSQGAAPYRYAGVLTPALRRHTGAG